MGVAGTQRCIHANERPQQAVFNNGDLSAQKYQHEYNGHTKRSIHSEHRPKTKEANGVIKSFLL